MSTTQNKNVVMIMGKPNTGKSASLRKLPMESMVYLNSDLKPVPFVDRFMHSIEIATASDVIDYIDQIEQEPSATGAVLDTMTFLMSMYERQVVSTSVNTQQAWGYYGNFYRDVIHKIKSGKKNYVIICHEDSVLNEQTNQMESKVPIKGAVGKIGVEADFSTVLGSLQVPVRKLKDINNDLLTVTPEEEEDGIKYVFATRISKETAGAKYRAPMGMWKREELYIDNDVQAVFDRIHKYNTNQPY